MVGKRLSRRAKAREEVNVHCSHIFRKRPLFENDDNEKVDRSLTTAEPFVIKTFRKHDAQFKTILFRAKPKKAATGVCIVLHFAEYFVYE